MRRLALACAASILLYALAFGLLLDRPLSHGFLRDRMEAKLARGAALMEPKLVIIAGSNGPYSHRCEAMEPILRRPCVNAGVAVGIGLDTLFARWKPLLRPGDIVYLPLEQAQYTRPRAAIIVGPDAAIMLRHDRGTLAALPPDRWLGAVFAFDLRALVMSGLEMTLHAAGFRDPRAAFCGMNAWGDQVGHTAALAAAHAAGLAAMTPTHLAAEAITAGEGSREVARFIAWARDRGISVVGGLSTGFEDHPIPAPTLAAIRAVYEDLGARFLALPTLSRYPRSAFFDSPDHLHEDAQIAHARLVAWGLAGEGGGSGGGVVPCASWVGDDETVCPNRVGMRAEP
jgi:hypothetical protein